MRDIKHPPLALKIAPKIALAIALGTLAPFALGACAREGLTDYGTAYKTVFPNQILNPGPPSAVPPEGMSGPMAVRAVEKYGAGDEKKNSGSEATFVLGNMVKTGITDKSK